ncbi:MAG: 4'-phosphopantetheinyl transferase superfamily protein [Bacteroidetes bacterium]|jgi:4'-phosphopantetheinyl transferase|nr:4'-phosphopantetheinyl transferase superfamily protein [Bacteroidota bacterium]
MLAPRRHIAPTTRSGDATTPLYWLIQTQDDLPPDDDWLAASERAVLETLRFERRRASWRLGRWTAKCALSAFLTPTQGSVPPATLAVLASESGAPVSYLYDDPLPAALSISHRNGLACSAVAPSGVALGCDLEAIEPRTEAFVADYLTPDEQAMVADRPEHDRAFWTNLIWSAKESALKALQTGLRLDTRRVIVQVLPPTPATAPWHPLRVQYPDQDRTFEGWYRRFERHVLTVVATPSPTVPVSLWSGDADA